MKSDMQSESEEEDSDLAIAHMKLEIMELREKLKVAIASVQLKQDSCNAIAQQRYASILCLVSCRDSLSLTMKVSNTKLYQFGGKVNPLERALLTTHYLFYCYFSVEQTGDGDSLSTRSEPSM